MRSKRTSYWVLGGVLLLATAAAVGPAPAAAQPWSKTYGTPGGELVGTIQQTSDGGYVVAGQTNSFGAGGDDFWVLKLDGSGAIQWQRAYGTAVSEVADSIHQTADGGYVLAGRTISLAGDFDIWVLKLDANGEIQWSRAYGGPGSEEARAVRQTSDGGYVVAGWTVPILGFGDFLVLRLDGDGNILWQKTYGGPDDDRAYSIEQTPDGGYVVAGSGSSGAGGRDFWALKLDGDGEIQWQRAYGGPREDRGQSIWPTSDGGYVMTGKTRSFGSGKWDLWVLKLDGSGAIQWQRAYGGPGDDRGQSVRETSDGGYVLAGKSRSFSSGSGDGWILKLDGSGDIQWQRIYGGADGEWARFVQETSDGGYIATAWVASFGAGKRDFWVLKLDGNGDLPGCEVGSPTSATVTDTNATVTTTASVPKAFTGGSVTVTATVTPTTVTPAPACFPAIDIRGSVAIGGAPVVGAGVTLRNKITKAESSTTTDGTGSYQFDPVDPGRYKIVIKPLVVSATATVSGTLQVKDLPSVGTRVKLKNTDTGARMIRMTDAGGNFAFVGVGPGNYKLLIAGAKVP